MKSVKIVQEHLPDIIKVVFLPAPIDLGRFTVRILEETLPKIKEELGLDFDSVKVYTGAQPRESGDIELYKDGKLVKKISVKTAVTGEIRVTLRKIWHDLVKGIDGIIIAFAFAKTGKKEDLTKILLIYLPSEVAKHTREDVLEEIETLVVERARAEGFQSIRFFAVNEALMFELVYRSVIAEEKAEQAYKEAKKAREKAEQAYGETKKAREKAEQAYKEAKKVREEIREVKEKIGRIDKKLSQILERL